MTAGQGWGLADAEGGPLDGYVNSILARVVSVSPLPNVPARVVVIDLAGSAGASAARDGTIYVPLKLLADMADNPEVGSEDALAFLLAHELSHILYFHFDSDAVGDVLEAGLVAGEVAHGVLVELSKLGDQSELGVLSKVAGKAASTSKDVEKLYGRAYLVKSLEETALSPAWTRKQENEADLLAFDLVVEAGYNPNASYDFMDLLQAYEETENARKAALDRAREAELEESFAESMKKGDGGAGLANAFGIAVAHAVDELKGTLSREHATVDDRRKRLFEYHDRWSDQVEEAEDVDYRELVWHADRSSGFGEWDAEEIRGIFDNYASARSARDAILGGQLEDARELIGKALSPPTERNAFPRVVAALYHDQIGEHEKAAEHLRQALNGPGASFPVYEKLLRYLPHDEQLAVLDEAERRFGGFVRLMQLRATVLEKMGRDEEAAEIREGVLRRKRNVEGPPGMSEGGRRARVTSLESRGLPSRQDQFGDGTHTPQRALRRR